MSSFDIKEMIATFDSTVEDRFKEFFARLFNSYRKRQTKKKLAYIILNLPLGAILKEEDVECLSGDEPPKPNEVLDILKKKKRLLNMVASRLQNMPASLHDEATSNDARPNPVDDRQRDLFLDKDIRA